MDLFQTPQPRRLDEVGITFAMDISPPALRDVNSGVTGQILSKKPIAYHGGLGSPPSEEWSLLAANAPSSSCSSSSSVPGPDMAAFDSESSSPSKGFLEEGSVPAFLQIPSKSNDRGFKLAMRPRNVADDDDDALLLESETLFLPVSPLAKKPEVSVADAGVSRATLPETRETSSCEMDRASEGPLRVSLKRRSLAAPNGRSSRCRTQRTPNEKIFLPHF